MSGTLAFGTVTNPAVLAKHADLAVAVPVVIDASAGVNGAVLTAGTILTKQGNGRYLPAASGDSVTIGSTKVLAQTITLDGDAHTNVAGFVAAYLNKAFLLGTTAQIAALGPEVEPGVIVMKQW